MHLKNFFPFLNFYNLSKNTQSVHVKSEDLSLILHILKLHKKTQYNLLSCISGVDYPFRNYRFCVVYEFLSIRFNSRLRLKVFIDELSSIESIVSFCPAANWWEREIWDMFGIFFTNNFDLKRILSDYGFEGFPLRKDFPLSGYTETRYVDHLRRVSCEPLEQSQEFRLFKIYSNWTTQLTNSTF